MKKVLIFLLMVGVLALGTCAVAEEMSETSEHVNFSGEENIQDSYDNLTFCGGGDVDGGGPIPG